MSLVKESSKWNPNGRSTRGGARTSSNYVLPEPAAERNQIGALDRYSGQVEEEKVCNRKIRGVAGTRGDASVMGKVSESEREIGRRQGVVVYY